MKRRTKRSATVRAAPVRARQGSYPYLRHKHVRGETTGRRILDQGRIRLLCVGLVFFMSFSAISARLMELAFDGTVRQFARMQSDARTGTPQGEENPDAVELAANEGSAEPVTGEERRVNIVDRNGVVLATSLGTASLIANPKVMRDREKAAQLLARELPGMSPETLRKRLSQKKGFVYLKRNLTPSEQQRVHMLGIPGIGFEPEERRVYPYGAMLSHVLGYVDVDGHGLAGVERYFDERLIDRDREPLTLSVDVRLQAIVYEELRRGVEEFQAIGATGVLMDLSSGELLAMANLPDFDPHRPASIAKPENRFNRAALGTYEMGSTFKTLTAAMALDYGTATMKSGYDATNPIHVAGFTITDSHPEARFLTVPEIFAYSSNIGTVKMALDVGVQRQKAFLKKLGLMEPVAIELPEKAAPLVPKDWREINLMTISYGHGMAVTPLHLVRAIGALVGDGRLPRLTLLKDGNARFDRGEAVAKADTVQNVRRLLRLVVRHGTGSKAEVPGYRVGGKTGTAEKVQASGYNANAKLTLFVSAFPVDAPRYVLLVMVDEPKPTKATFGFATGGWTAAPMAGRIISRMGAVLGIAPEPDPPADDAENFWVQAPGKPQKTVVSEPAFEPARWREGLHAVAY